MIRSQSTRHVIFSSLDPFDQYCREMADQFCPFLHPAERTGTLFATTVVSEADTEQELIEDVLYACIERTEALRKLRFGIDPKRALLACDNVMFAFPPKFRSLDGNHFLDWPHSILKHLYISVGLMFGKFWSTEVSVSRDGLSIPPVPCHALMVLRSAITGMDARFLNISPHLLPEFMTAIDAGEDVHLSIGGEKMKCVNAASLRNIDYYTKAIEWVKAKSAL